MTKRKQTQPINMGKFLVSKGRKTNKSKGPVFWTDPYNGVLEYVSPLSGRRISSRDDRKREMKEFNVREVDPSEGPHQSGTRYNNPEFIRRYNIR